MPPFKLRPDRKKLQMGSKSLYLPQTYIDYVNKLAAAHSTSFNNIVASMIAVFMEEDGAFKQDS